MDSLIYFGQYVRQQRLRKGMSQKRLSLKIFDRPNAEYIGRLERGTLKGITFATCDKILMALDSEMKFERYPTYVPDLHRRYNL
jgi:transcriptional regulator with XRE-family HTH domain